MPSPPPRAPTSASTASIPRGLSGFDDAAEIASLPNDPSLNLGLSALQRELQTSQDSLRVLSDETGGFAAVNSNDFAKGFERIIRDNSSYYVLGYYSNDSKRDGQFRTLTVRVKRPGLQVRARKGYTAPKGRPPAGTRRAGGHCRVGRHARSARQSRARHRTRDASVRGADDGGPAEGVRAGRRRARGPGAQVQAGRAGLRQQRRSGDPGDGRRREDPRRRQGHGRAQAAPRYARPRS